METAIELEPQNAFALRSLGSLLVIAGAFAAGVARFRQALEVAPDDLITTYNLAQALAGTRSKRSTATRPIGCCCR